MTTTSSNEISWGIWPIFYVEKQSIITTKNNFAGINPDIADMQEQKITSLCKIKIFGYTLDEYTETTKSYQMITKDYGCNTDEIFLRN